MFMIRHIFYFIFIYLNGNLARFLTMVSPNGPFASKNFFRQKNYQLLVQIGLALRRLVQISAGWCSLKGHSQLCDPADLDTTFVSFEKSIPQPEIK